ncbi:hypothetical protein [Streptomyces sp. WAC00263]|uniref:hypothetical protein n=1 Tax=Streptomyces sp. WAC00263 TaxID=1917422 RepID=UPI0009D005AE|nr:hypothetical protein [Streptomyces sp. WAC00263]KAF5996702.1 hypothetical protein BOG92_037825 [Streptomyces sp. WAC00263]
MSFDQEWAELKAKSAMRLDSVPADPGGSSPDGADLILRYDDMGKIGHAAFLLHQHLSSAGKHAQSHTEAAAKSLESDGFDMGAALAKAEEGWQGQLQVLVDACAQISNHLDYSVKSSKQDDHVIAAQIQVSKISEYLDVPPSTSDSDAPHVPKADGPIM